MELEILRMLIEQRNKKLNEPFKRHKCYDYLMKAKDDLDEDVKLIMSYLAMSTNKSPEECFEIVKGLGLCNLKFSDAEFALIINALVYFKVTNTIHQVKDYYSERNPFKTVKTWNKIERRICYEKKDNICPLSCNGMFTLCLWKVRFFWKFFI